MRDGVEQVGLPQPGDAVDEQRVVAAGRGLGDRQGGGLAKRFEAPVTKFSNV